MSREELGGLVCETLNRHGITVVLSGGAAVSIYSHNAYESAGRRVKTSSLTSLPGLRNEAHSSRSTESGPACGPSGGGSSKLVGSNPPTRAGVTASALGRDLSSIWPGNGLRGQPYPEQANGSPGGSTVVTRGESRGRGVREQEMEAVSKLLESSLHWAEQRLEQRRGALGLRRQRSCSDGGHLVDFGPRWR